MRKIESLNNRQISRKPVHIGLNIIFIVGKKKVSRQLQSSRTWILVLTLFRMGFFGAACWWGRGGGFKKAPSLKSVTHILQWWNLAQLYLTQEDKKNINHVTHPLSSADISIFSLEISTFCHIKKYRYGWLIQIQMCLYRLL